MAKPCTEHWGTSLKIISRDIVNITKTERGTDKREGRKDGHTEVHIEVCPPKKMLELKCPPNYFNGVLDESQKQNERTFLVDLAREKQDCS